MSILSNIFSMFTGGGAPAGGDNKAEQGAASGQSQAYADCIVYATPQREGSQFRLAGRIEKQVGTETLVRNFIRADVFTSMDDAVETTFRKAQQIIDQNGPSLFGDGEKVRQV